MREIPAQETQDPQQPQEPELPTQEQADRATIFQSLHQLRGQLALAKVNYQLARAGVRDAEGQNTEGHAADEVRNAQRAVDRVQELWDAGGEIPGPDSDVIEIRRSEIVRPDSELPDIPA